MCCWFDMLSLLKTNTTTAKREIYTTVPRTIIVSYVLWCDRYVGCPNFRTQNKHWVITYLFSKQSWYCDLNCSTNPNNRQYLQAVSICRILPFIIDFCIWMLQSQMKTGTRVEVAGGKLKLIFANNFTRLKWQGSVCLVLVSFPSVFCRKNPTQWWARLVFKTFLNSPLFMIDFQ